MMADAQSLLVVVDTSRPDIVEAPDLLESIPKITVIDHKTKSESSMKSEVSIYRHQLYLYAEYVKQHYGEFPDTIQCNMMYSEKPIIEQFSPERHEETLNWLENTITDILFETQWNPNPKQYYCKFICSMLPYCEVGMDISQYCPRKNK